MHFCPQLTALELSDCYASFESTIAAICELDVLESLQFNCCKWVVGALPPSLMMPTTSECLQTLSISGTLIGDTDLANVLRMTAAHVRNLSVSVREYGSYFCTVIVEQVPMLESLTIDWASCRPTS